MIQSREELTTVRLGKFTVHCLPRGKPMYIFYNKGLKQHRNFIFGITALDKNLKGTKILAESN